MKKKINLTLDSPVKELKQLAGDVFLALSTITLFMIISIKLMSPTYSPENDSYKVKHYTAYQGDVFDIAIPVNYKLPPNTSLTYCF